MFRDLRWLAAWSVGALTLAMPILAPAGTVFLKNGYVIQGEIVERNNEGVALRWADGRAMIYDRFIVDVIVEPQELAALEKRELLVSETPEVAQLARTPRREILRLPATLEEVMSPETAVASARTAPSIEAHNPTTVPPVEVVTPDMSGSDVTAIEVAENSTADGMSPDSSDTEQMHVSEVPNPVQIESIVPARTSELVFPELGFAITPPAGWMVVEDEDAVQLRFRSDQPFPSLHISVQLEGATTVEEAGPVLERVLRARFPQISVEEVRQQQIGFERAFVVVGEWAEKQLTFSQALIPHGGSHYLVGVQLPEPVDADLRRQLHRAMHSIRFLSE